MIVIPFLLPVTDFRWVCEELLAKEVSWGAFERSAGRLFPLINRDTKKHLFSLDFIMSRCVNLKYDSHLVIVEEGDTRTKSIQGGKQSRNTAAPGICGHC